MGSLTCSNMGCYWLIKCLSTPTMRPVQKKLQDISSGITGNDVFILCSLCVKGSLSICGEKQMPQQHRLFLESLPLATLPAFWQGLPFWTSGEVTSDLYFLLEIKNFKGTVTD